MTAPVTLTGLNHWFGPFHALKDIDLAIETGEERITDEAVQAWQPVWTKHAWNIPRQPAAAFG